MGEAGSQAGAPLTDKPTRAEIRAAHKALAGPWDDIPRAELIRMWRITRPGTDSSTPGCLYVILIAIYVLLILGAIGSWHGIGPALRAAHGHGTAGRFIAQQYVCSGKYHNICQWLGKFESPGGTVIIPEIAYDGTVPAHTHAGASIPALYDGPHGDVYARHGSTFWAQDLCGLLFCLGLLILLFWLTAARPVIRRLRARRH